MAVSVADSTYIPSTTMCSEADNVEVRQPLQNRWSLWYLKVDRNKDWEDCIKMITTFDTVEDFWSLYDHIQSAGGLKLGSGYYLFKEGIKPMWEDVNNVQGGRWYINGSLHTKSAKHSRQDKQKKAELIDHYWLEMLLAVVGEQFDGCGEYICGAVVSVRAKGNKSKVSLWTRDATLDDINLRIGLVLKEKLGIPDSQPLKYEAHKDSSTATSSSIKPIIVIPLSKKESKSEKTEKSEKSDERTPPTPTSTPLKANDAF